VLLFSVLGLSLIAINEIGDRLMSGSTAYIAGEGRWTKAQKEAALSLVKYATTEELEFYVEYLNHLEVIEGDRMARTELNAPRPNYERVRNSFLRGGNQPAPDVHTSDLVLRERRSPAAISATPSTIGLRVMWWSVF
jgi:hypothetical protein